MRVKNSQLVSYLKQLNLPWTLLQPAINFLAYGEQLKSFEQRLVFLKRCHQNHLSPHFIEDNFRFNTSNLFPSGVPPSVQKFADNVPTLSLKSNINEAHRVVRSAKYHLRRLNDHLLSHCSRFHYDEIQQMFQYNNHKLKSETKCRLQTKFRTLRWERHAARHVPEPPPEGLLTPAQKVTAIGVSLTEKEESVLALGPGFALSPKIDDTLISDIQTQLAHTTYKVRWKESINTTDTCPTLLQHAKREAPFLRPYAKPPPSDNLALEHNLRQLECTILSQLRITKTRSNLTPDQREGLRSLLNRRDELHFSRSDKGGEFVVLNKDVQQMITEKHLQDGSTQGVYEYQPPTTTVKGRTQPIAQPSEGSFLRQIKSKTRLLETEANNLWSYVTSQYKFDNALIDLFKKHNSQLPVLYVLQKTHKFDCTSICQDVCQDDLNVNIVNMCKVRPIVSCCDSPTEKLAWLVTHFLAPLLQFIPSHLQNIHSHLTELQSIPIDKMKGHQFFSADVCSLYTNISIEASVESLMELAVEHWEHLNTWGISPGHIHLMLEYVLHNSYFTYRRKLYKQWIM